MVRQTNRWICIFEIVCIWVLVMGTSAVAVAQQALPESPPQSAESNWYILRNGQNYGPYSQTQMEAFVATGVLTADTQICLAESDRWVRADTVFSELASHSPVASVPGLVSERLTEEEANRIYPEVRSARQLTALGVGVWSAGKALQLVSLAILLKTIFSDDDHTAAFWGTFFTGTGLDILSPIPSVIGEHRVQQALSETAPGSLSGGRKMIPAGVFHGVGAGLILGGIALATSEFRGATFEGNSGIYSASTLMFVAGEVCIAFSNFSAFKRIRRFESRYLAGIAMVPYVGNRTTGFSLIKSF